MAHPGPPDDEHGDDALTTDLGSSEGQAQDPADEATRELRVAPAAESEDRCTACGASLAHDQHYCVECGERRGPSRFPVAQPVTEVRTRRAYTTRPPRAPRMSSGATLVAGVGVLLLAIGLGVLIGRINNNNNASTRASAPAQQVITVQSGGGGAAAAATTTPTNSSTTVHVTEKAKAKLNAAAKATAPPPVAVQKKATQAAGKVLGNSKNLAPPTVTTGQKCSGNQAGCSGGTFNGNFFGQ
ncbi:MAG: hypothetical protein JO363_11595 [Solirubrobacterales bacterium]|nr:hypothetical protein [Solirubrobacterales bacterium]